MTDTTFLTSHPDVLVYLVGALGSICVTILTANAVMLKNLMDKLLDEMRDHETRISRLEGRVHE